MYTFSFLPSIHTHIPSQKSNPTKCTRFEEPSARQPSYLVARENPRCREKRVRILVRKEVACGRASFGCLEPRLPSAQVGFFEHVVVTIPTEGNSRDARASSTMFTPKLIPTAWRRDAGEADRERRGAVGRCRCTR